MNTIDARENHFNDIAVVESKTDATILLYGIGVTLVVDENGKEQNMERFFVESVRHVDEIIQTKAI